MTHCLPTFVVLITCVVPLRIDALYLPDLWFHLIASLGTSPSHTHWYR
jgi:hypothetical protein